MQQPTNNLCRRSSSGPHHRLHVVYVSGLLLLGLIAVALFSDNQGLASSAPGLVSQWSAEGNGVGNVTVSLGGLANRTTTTNANGWYPFGEGTTTFQIWVMATAPGTLTNTMNVTGPFVEQDLSNNTVITTTDVQAMPVPAGSACVPPPTGIVAWYPGDGNPNDIIAGHNGVLAWHYYWTDANGDGHNWLPAVGEHGATFGPGLVGEAFSLDGNSFVELEDTVNGTVGVFGREPFTIALWAKFNGACLQDVHCSESFISVDGGWTFWFEALGIPEIDNGETVVSGALHFSNYSSEGEKPPVVTFDHWIPEPDRWYHLAVTRSTDNPSCVDAYGETRTPDTYTLYIDGLRVSENVRGRDDGVCVGPVDFPNYPRLLIGAETEANSFFVGSLDEIGIWHHALSGAEIQSIFSAGSYGMCKTSSFTSAGQNVVVQTSGADLRFSEVSATGTSSVVPIDPATVGQVPGGFAVASSVAYEISTTAAFTGPVTLAFKVPGPISEEDFNSLAILHNVNGTLVEVTALTPPRDYANLTIYATTDSFSPFYLARKGPHIKTLFDQTKAYKSGSTIPVKLQLLSASNSNVSSSNTALVARDLRLMSGNTTAPVVDSGNSNPDYTFRYDATLGATGGGYIFNLSTKGLASGQYVLSFYVGNDRSFFYTVRFEVR